MPCLNLSKKHKWEVKPAAFGPGYIVWCSFCRTVANRNLRSEAEARQIVKRLAERGAK